MPPRDRPTRARHPVLRVEVLSSAGVRMASERVFCRLRRESVPVVECASCRHCDAIREGPRPTVECTFALPRERAVADLTGERTEVGTLLSGGTAVVEASCTLAIPESMPVRAALRLLASRHLREISVVAPDGTPLGIFRDIDGLQWVAAARRGEARDPCLCDDASAGASRT